MELATSDQNECSTLVCKLLKIVNNDVHFSLCFSCDYRFIVVTINYSIPEVQFCLKLLDSLSPNLLEKLVSIPSLVNVGISLVGMYDLFVHTV